MGTPARFYWHVLGCLVVVAACVAPPTAPAEDAECYAICDVVVDECELPTWPSYDSCLDGCLASGDAGADLASHQRCVELSNCDLFFIVECEHDFGPPPQDDRPGGA